MRVVVPVSILFVYTLLQCVSVSTVGGFPDLTILDERVIMDRRVNTTVMVQLGFADEAGEHFFAPFLIYYTSHNKN